MLRRALMLPFGRYFELAGDVSRAIPDSGYRNSVSLCADGVENQIVSHRNEADALTMPRLFFVQRIPLRHGFQCTHGAHEIGGDVAGLEKALKSVNSIIKSTQGRLKDVERLLKPDPSHTELLSQKQALLKESISATKEKLDALKTAQAQVKQQMENGTPGKEKYDTLQRELIETEQELQRLAREAANADTALTRIGEAGKTLENVGNKMSSVGSSLTRNVTVPILAIGTANEDGNAFRESEGFMVREDLVYRNRALTAMVRMGT